MFVSDDKIICLYHATIEDVIREHGHCRGFPVDTVQPVRATINPAIAELTS